MKTTNLILVAMMMLFATVSFAHSEPDPANAEPAPTTNDVVKISLKDALENRGLTFAIERKVSPKLIENEQPGPYVAKVLYNHTTYLVIGTLEQWRRFFYGVNVLPIINER